MPRVTIMSTTVVTNPFSVAIRYIHSEIRNLSRLSGGGSAHINALACGIVVYQKNKNKLSLDCPGVIPFGLSFTNQSVFIVYK